MMEMYILCRAAALLCLWPAPGVEAQRGRLPEVVVVRAEAGSLRREEAAGAFDAHEEFDGRLEKGRSYSAAVVCDKDTGLRLKKRVRVPYHHAVRVEWLDLPDLPKSPGCEFRVVFEVVSKEVYPIDPPRRWNTTYKLRILRRLT